MRRLVLIAVAVVLSILLAGASYEALASGRDAETYPAPGALVDVDGRRMHLNCVGEGSPTIILDAGLGGSSLDWNLVQPELARTTRTCSYDRAGMGWSDPAPGRRTPQQIATELAALLDRAGVEGPYILVAHSLAGKNARVFAMRDPGDVVGMVLIDTRHEYIDDHTTDEEERTFRDNVADQAARYSLARRLGIVRLFGSSLAGVPSMEETVRRQMAIMATSSSAIASSSAEAAERAGSDELLQAAPSLGQTPLIVLAAGQSMNEPRWAEAQRRMSVLSSRGRLIVAQGSSHAVEWDQPALVIATVRELVTEVQGGASP